MCSGLKDCAPELFQVWLGSLRPLWFISTQGWSLSSLGVDSFEDGLCLSDLENRQPVGLRREDCPWARKWGGGAEPAEGKFVWDDYVPAGFVFVGKDVACRPPMTNLKITSLFKAACT